MREVNCEKEYQSVQKQSNTYRNIPLSKAEFVRRVTNRG